MKIVICGATGNVGRRVSAEALRGGQARAVRGRGDQLLADAEGKRFISFEDYAVAVLDELERPQHVGRRFGVAY